MENNLIYGVCGGFQTRALVAQQNSEEIRFFVGTQVLNQKNQIHLIEIEDESENLKSKIFSHEGEIWKLSSSPHANFLACVYSSSLSMKTSLLKIPEAIFDDSQNEILEFDSTEVLELDIAQGSEIRTTEFHPNNIDTLATVTDSKLFILNRSEAKTQTVGEVNTKNSGKFAGGKWYNANQFVVMHENAVKSYDTRDSNHLAFEIQNAHIQPLRDLDVNPNKAFIIATVGDDSALKIWDVRNNKQPLFSRRDHQHWITSVSFNKFHDQLILTSSTDGTVVLTCAVSCSSENIVNEDEKEISKTQLPDGLLEKFEHLHEDSVYKVEWSTADPWIFASLSWDGRVVIKKVPKKYKYQILL